MFPVRDQNDARLWTPCDFSPWGKISYCLLMYSSLFLELQQPEHKINVSPASETLFYQSALMVWVQGPRIWRCGAPSSADRGQTARRRGNELHYWGGHVGAGRLGWLLLPVFGTNGKCDSPRPETAEKGRLIIIHKHHQHNGDDKGMEAPKDTNDGVCARWKREYICVFVMISKGQSCV